MWHGTDMSQTIAGKDLRPANCYMSKLVPFRPFSLPFRHEMSMACEYLHCNSVRDTESEASSQVVPVK